MKRQQKHVANERIKALNPKFPEYNLKENLFHAWVHIF